MATWLGTITPTSYFPENRHKDLFAQILHAPDDADKATVRGYYRQHLLGYFKEDDVKRMMFDVVKKQNKK